MRRPSLEDTVGKIELIAFPQNYEKLAEKLKIDVPVLVRGVAARRRRLGAEALRSRSIQALEDVKIKLPDALRIKVPLHNPGRGAAREAARRSSSTRPAKASCCSTSKSRASSAPCWSRRGSPSRRTCSSSSAWRSWWAAGRCRSSRLGFRAAVNFVTRRFATELCCSWRVTCRVADYDLLAAQDPRSSCVSEELPHRAR